MKKSSKLTDQTLKFPEFENALASLFPESGKILLTGGGMDFVERIGVEAIRNAVFSVLNGQNIRTQTEPISRRRLAQISGAIIAMFTQGYLKVPDFQAKLSGLAVDQLKTARGNANVWPAQWVIGLTGKQVQNVLRSNPAEFENYIKDFEVAIKDAAKHCSEQLGEYKMALGFIENKKGHQVMLDWEGIARLTTAIGAQTLSIRGSEKATYGKLFERLVLGSVLTLLGFKRVDPKTNKELQGVFWLSDSTDNRESDATVIVSPGRLARFDIGFIGPGNPEISKDKLSRYGNELQTEAGDVNTSTTFIVVDRLPETSKTQEAAKKIGAEIIQMSMQFWPRLLATKLSGRFDFKHEIENISDHDLPAYIRKHLEGLQVQNFLKGISVEEISENGVNELDNADVIEDEE